MGVQEEKCSGSERNFLMRHCPELVPRKWDTPPRIKEKHASSYKHHNYLIGVMDHPPTR